MSIGKDVIESFFTPLNIKLRVRLRSNSFWDDFVPHRKLAELTEHIRSLDPDDLTYAVAQGADRLTARFGIKEGSVTYQALEILMNRTSQRAERLKPIWRDLLTLMENTPQQARLNALKETAKFVLSGDVTLGAALKEIFFSLGDIDKARDTAQRINPFFLSLDAFVDGVIDDFDNIVVPQLMKG